MDLLCNTGLDELNLKTAEPLFLYLLGRGISETAGEEGVGPLPKRHLPPHSR